MIDSERKHGEEVYDYQVVDEENFEELSKHQEKVLGFVSGSSEYTGGTGLGDLLYLGRPTKVEVVETTKGLTGYNRTDSLLLAGAVIFLVSRRNDKPRSLKAISSEIEKLSSNYFHGLKKGNGKSVKKLLKATVDKVRRREEVFDGFCNVRCRHHLDYVVRSWEDCSETVVDDINDNVVEDCKDKCDYLESEGVVNGSSRVAAASIVLRNELVEQELIDEPPSFSTITKVTGMGKNSLIENNDKIIKHI